MSGLVSLASAALTADDPARMTSSTSTAARCLWRRPSRQIIRRAITRRSRWPKYSMWSILRRCAGRCVRNTARSRRILPLSITSIPGAPTRFDSDYPATPLDQLPDYACEAFAGVGNPFFWGGPRPGERVVDLGSGAGMDSFLAALWVGNGGHVIGVDMTPEMLDRSRSMAARLGLDNVEFREGVIEGLPIEDGAADVRV